MDRTTAAVRSLDLSLEATASTDSRINDDAQTLPSKLIRNDCEIRWVGGQHRFDLSRTIPAYCPHSTSFSYTWPSCRKCGRNDTIGEARVHERQSGRIGEAMLTLR